MLSKLMNLGCGSTYHPDWINIDIVAHSEDVLEHDLTKGIPAENNTVDVIYHSAVLEHLSLSDGTQFLKEIHRVLKPNGILRMAIPDLGSIARNYIRTLDLVQSGNEEAVLQHKWMTIELLDQMVRSSPSGEMGRYLRSDEPKDLEFIRSRIGLELDGIIATNSTNKEKRSLVQKFKRIIRLAPIKLRDYFIHGLILVFYGSSRLNAFKLSKYRQRGEVHKWMYDKYSISKLLSSIGYKEIEFFDAHTSNISGFEKYNLDAVDGVVRKPDCFFVEAIK